MNSTILRSTDFQLFSARIILLFAALKSFIGLLGSLLVPTLSNTGMVVPIPWWVFSITISVFTGTAAILVFGVRGRDIRAIHLGTIYLCAAAAFADPVLQSLKQSIISSFFLLFVIAIQPEAFIPYFFWLFAKDFPRTVFKKKTERIISFTVWLSFVVAIFLFIISFLMVLMPTVLPVSLSTFFSLIARTVNAARFWTLVFGLTIPVLPLIAMKSRLATPLERRRARFFIWALVIPGIPISLEILLEGIIPSFKNFIDQPEARLAGSFVAYPLMLSVPITTTYSVIVHRVLDVRLIIRRALQYALARITLLIVAAVPFTSMAWYFYLNRYKTLAELFTGPRLFILSLAAIVVIAGFKLRVPLLNLLDRRFFREQFDARQVLTSLIEECRDIESPEELAGLFTSEIDRVLHLKSLAVLIHESRSNELVSPIGGTTPLSGQSQLIEIITKANKPIEINPESKDPVFYDLPNDDQQWIKQGSFRLFVPLIGSEGRSMGIIALGEKRSELPFSHEDRSLLTALAASGSLTLENKLLRTPSPRSTTFADPSQTPEKPYIINGKANECLKCGNIYAPDTEICENCSAVLVEARVPYQLADKFRFVERIGQGGMGVVYKAIDLTLDRKVAVKTLPRLSARGVLRMRHEARAMAAVSHPHLALILGSETWEGTPMLIFEYLAGGTLAQRIRRSQQSIPEIISLGIVLADVLSVIHDAKILHRDIKPSNIGYRIDGTPKLLDFGLARILVGRSSKDQRATASFNSLTKIISNTATLSKTTLTAAGHLVGTPLYLSPEAVLSKSPDVSFDLWALALSLYEAIAGRNPMGTGTVQETLHRILNEPVLKIQKFRPDCPDRLAAFFDIALARERSLRPSSAQEMKKMLQEIHSQI